MQTFKWCDSWFGLNIYIYIYLSLIFNECKKLKITAPFTCRKEKENFALQDPLSHKDSTIFRHP